MALYLGTKFVELMKTRRSYGAIAHNDSTERCTRVCTRLHTRGGHLAIPAPSWFSALRLCVSRHMICGETHLWVLRLAVTFRIVTNLERNLRTKGKANIYNGRPTDVHSFWYPPRTTVLWTYALLHLLAVISWCSACERISSSISPSNGREAVWWSSFLSPSNWVVHLLPRMLKLFKILASESRLANTENSGTVLTTILVFSKVLLACSSRLTMSNILLDHAQCNPCWALSTIQHNVWHQIVNHSSQTTT